MSDYDNTNRGALFVNDRKQSDKQPDWNGKLNIEGTEYWLSGWVKEGRKGEFLSLSLGAPVDAPAETRRPASTPRALPSLRRPAAASRAPAPAPSRAPSGFDDMDDDIPF